MDYMEMNNKVCLVGEIVKEPIYSHEVFGEGFYEAFIKVKRLSEQVDVLPMTVSERLVTETGLEVGQRIAVKGQFRSYNKVEGTRSRLMLTVFAGLNAFEREVMLERQREGIDAMPVVNGVRVSGKNGRTYGRKKDEVDGFEEVRREVEEGRISVTEGCRRLGISRSKWYRMNERSE